MASGERDIRENDYKDLFKVRTVTCFVRLRRRDFAAAGDGPAAAEAKLERALGVAVQVRAALTAAGYVVQTVRLATNPFPDWLCDEDGAPSALEDRLRRIEAVLERHEIEFCALGPARHLEELPVCLQILQRSARFSCSAALAAADARMAGALADTVLRISRLRTDGLDNFRFCATTSAPYIPFFPAARAEAIGDGDDNDDDGRPAFALGLENGCLARRLLGESRSLDRVADHFRTEYARALYPLEAACRDLAVALGADYRGIDTSLNPSLEAAGSVAAALELLDPVAQAQGFGGPGTLAAAASVTRALQSLPDIRTVGYCGLMLPLCEDARLAELSRAGALTVGRLLSVSHVCGVGIDTVPVPGDCAPCELSALLLDVAAVADRWGKSLSCRVFPVPSKVAGDVTDFDFPHVVNARIMPID